MRITVITVCYNEEKRISATMESVIRQNYRNIEYLIIDGKSEDSTLNIVKEYSGKDDRIRFFSERDTGLFNAMNKGIEMATGEYISFMNAGDSYNNPSVIGKVVDQLMDDKPDMLCGHTVVYGRNSRVGNLQGKTSLNLQNMIKILNMDWVCHQAIFYKSDTIKKFKYDENYLLAADYDLFLRYLKSRKSVIWSTTVICDYHLDGISNDSKYAQQILKEDEISIRENYGFLAFFFCRRIWPRLHC